MKNENIVFRASPELKSQLAKTSEKLGINTSMLIRIVLNKQLDQFEKTGNLFELFKKDRDESDETDTKLTR